MQAAYEHKKQQKIAELAYQQDLRASREITSQPLINEKSRRMVSAMRRAVTPVHSRPKYNTFQRQTVKLNSA
jgi:hypothetical protein